MEQSERRAETPVGRLSLAVGFYTVDHRPDPNKEGRHPGMANSGHAKGVFYEEKEIEARSTLGRSSARDLEMWV